MQTVPVSVTPYGVRLLPPEMKIKAQPLAADAFSSFGQVLMASGDGPQRDEYAARLTNRRPDATPNLTFSRNAPVRQPIVVDVLERHPHSSQTFVPLRGTRYLVVVCPAMEHGEPDLARVRAFVADGGQAISFDAGTWHAPKLVLDGPGEFVMLRWDAGSRDDTELRPLETAVEVVI